MRRLLRGVAMRMYGRSSQEDLNTSVGRQRERIEARARERDESGRKSSALRVEDSFAALSGELRNSGPNDRREGRD